MHQYIPYILSSIVGPLLGVLVYKMQARIQTKTMSDQAGIQAAQSPISVLTASVSARDAELKAARESHEMFMQALVAKFQSTTDRLTDTLSGIERSCQAHCQTMRDLQTAVLEHSRESNKGRGVLHSRLNAIQMQLAGVKVIPGSEGQTE